MKRAKTTCRCISFSFRATNPKSEQSSNFLFLMPKEKKPKQWVSRQERLRADAMQGILKIFINFCRATFNATIFTTTAFSCVTINRYTIERCTRLEQGFLVLFLQRASVLTGSSRVKIGASRSSSGETFFWTRQMVCYRTTNSRYSVRYIPLYVDCHIYSISLFAHIVS